MCSRAAGRARRRGEAAAQWIADEMKRIGLKPGNHGSCFQRVPAVNIALDPAKSSLVFNTPQGRDAIRNSPMRMFTGRRSSNRPM